MLSQSIRPKKIVLWLAIEQFPNKKLPNSLLKLQKKYKNRFEILWCNDIKSYKKLIPSLLIFEDYPIITADDDVYYHHQWLERLWSNYLKFPKCIHAHMVAEIALQPYSKWQYVTKQKKSNNYLGIGVGGILYPPHCLHNDIFNISNFQQLSPYADDLYFWAMAALNDTQIRLVVNPLGHPRQSINFWSTPNLYEKNCGENLNDIQFQNILSHYPQLKLLLE